MRCVFFFLISSRLSITWKMLPDELSKKSSMIKMGHHLGMMSPPKGKEKTSLVIPYHKVNFHKNMTRS